MKSKFAFILLVFSLGGLYARAEEKPAKAPEELVLEISKDVSLKLVKIPAGKFMMGVPKDAPNRDKQDLDEREVTFGKEFWMAATEVTQAQYEAVMGENPSKSGKEALHPVDCVSFNQAVAFCKKVSEKTGKTVWMPTEAEWEYAARAGGDGVGKAKLTDVAWCMENSEKKPHPVGTKTANAWVLHDMLGNAMEWVQGEKWVGYRGGAWKTPGAKCLPTHREGHGHLYNDPYGGFRVIVETK
jgi:formylglycine-generating enzyme required for sulfatase activity